LCCCCLLPPCSKLHPDFGEDLLQHQPASSSGGGVRLPAVLRLSCKVDLLDQVRVAFISLEVYICCFTPWPSTLHPE
jgi:hypothetical protein